MEAFATIFDRFGNLLLSGFYLTLLITITAIAIGLVLGFILSVMRIYGPKFLKGIAVTYIELVRGTPMVVQLFLIYYGLPSTGIASFTPVTAAIIGMGLNSAAYQAEYFRTAFLAIPTGQSDAAMSLGMSKTQLIFFILLPQLFRIVIPSWTNELIALAQYSSLAMIVTVMELTSVAKYIGSKTFLYLQAFTVVGGIYLIFSVILTRVMILFEKRLAIPGVSVTKLRV
jgi:polar amino acid transport system permease protein